MKKNVGISYKTFAVILAAVLILGGAIGGTMAWLIDKDEPVINTFTDSDINITLTESENLDLKMVPGHTITKDPEVTVEAGSEDCYLFVKIEKSDNYDTYLAPYAIAAGWSEVKDGENIVDGVYYRIVRSNDPTREFSLLASGSYGKEDEGDGVFTWADNQVLVKPSVTKSDMDVIDGKNADGTDNTEEIKNRPTLTFTAYAVQYMKNNDTSFTVAEAWAKAKGNEAIVTNN